MANHHHRCDFRSVGCQATIAVTAAENLAVSPGFISWGWPSEQDEPANVSDRQFVENLRKLADLYLQEPVGEAWMIKQRLGAFYDFFPDTRHALLRSLAEINWPDRAAALRHAVESGVTLVLTGEDLGIHPGSGLTVNPHYDARQFEALVTSLAGAKWKLATLDGETIVANLGQGRVILSRESVDAAGHDNPSILRWHQRWLG